MTKETKKKALTGLLVCIPAIITGLLSNWQASLEARQQNRASQEKAAAGYQVTRAAYEQMIKDVAELKAEMRLMRQIFVTNLASTGSVSSSYDYEDEVESEPVVVDDYVDEEIIVKSRSGRDVRLKKGELPDDLESAQQILE